MWKAALLFLPATLFAQLSPNSVTVTASRVPARQAPDQVVFSLTLRTPIETTLEAAAAALLGAGVTLSDFNGLGYSGSGEEARILWGFRLAAPLSKLKSTIGLLSAVQADVAKGSPFDLTYSVGWTQVSSEKQQAQPCTTSDLLADARAQAERLASGAGRSVGAILAISANTFRNSGADNGAIGGVLPPSVYSACTITVKFALGGF